MDHSVVQRWLRSVIGPYDDKDRVFADVDRSLIAVSSLSPKTEVFTFNDGRTQLLLNLEGTIPVQFRSNTYNIPVAYWIPRKYPREPPMAFVAPTPDMAIRKGPNVDSSGQIGGEYLARWRTKPEACNLLDLIHDCQQMFGKEPPVYAKPKQQQSMSPLQTQQPPKTPPLPQGYPQSPSASPSVASPPSSIRGYANTNNQYPSHSHDPRERPPPPAPGSPSPTALAPHRPPKPSNSAMTDAYYSPQSPRSSMSYPGPAVSQNQPQTLQNLGFQEPDQPRPPHHFSSPASPASPNQYRHFAGEGHVSDLRSPASRSGSLNLATAGPAPITTPQPHQGGPSASRHSWDQRSQVQRTGHHPSYVQSPYQQQSRPQQQPHPHSPQQQRQGSQQYPQQQTQQPQQHPPPLPPQPSSMLHQSQSQAQVPQSPASHAPLNAYPGHPHQDRSKYAASTGQNGTRPHHQMPQDLPPKPAVMNLLDEDEDTNTSQQVGSMSGPSSSTAAPPPPRPPNPELLALHNRLCAKIETRLSALSSALESSNRQLSILTSDLDRGRPAIEDEMSRLHAVRDVCKVTGDRLEQAVVEARDRLSLLKGKEDIDPDTMVLATSIVGNQLVDLVAEDNAIEDTLYQLGRALNAERIDLDRFLKQTRMLGREQFMKRALAMKISEGMGWS